MKASQAQGTKSIETGRARTGPSMWHFAWWSILLGLVMEALLLAVRANPFSSLQPVAEASGKVTWALMVCLGVALGKVLSSDKPLWVGFSGLTSAPVAFTAAQGVQKAVGQLLSLGGAVAAATVAVAAVRGVEYMCLGTALAVIARRSPAGPRLHLLAGLLTGLVFGGLIMLLTPATRASTAAVLSWGVNELVFPMGCAFVLYVGAAYSQRSQAAPAK